MSENVSALATAVSLLNKESDNLISNFGKLADTSKTWNIISRLLSGSGLWQLQNRAVGNMVNLYNLNLAKQLKSQQDAISGYQDMGNAIRDLGAEKDAVLKSDYASSLADAFKKAGYEETKAMEKAQEEISKKYDGAILALEKVQKGSIKRSVGAGDYLRDGTLALKGPKGRVALQEGQSGTKGFAQFTRTYMKGQQIQAIYYKRRIMAWFKEKRWKGLGTKAWTWMGKKSRKLGQFVDIGTTFFMQFMKYVLLATLVIFLLRGAWKMIKPALKSLGGVRQWFEVAFSGILDILRGVWNILYGIFKGDFGKVFKGLGQIIMGVMKIAVAALVIMGKLVIATLIALPLAIGKAIWKKITGRASGGIVREGMTLVGERGPELVSLPNGARVHTNSQSRKMGGGNTIHVHINGRVGANDAEIRDIANKVAREINMRMNRTSNTVGGF